MSCCEFTTENLLTITGITPSQTLTLTIPTDPCWRLSNYKTWCSLLIKGLISNSFFLLHVQREGPTPLRGGWVTPGMLQTESFSPKSSSFPWFKNKWWWIQSTWWPRQLSRLKQCLPTKASKRATSVFITCNPDPESRAVCCIAQNQVQWFVLVLKHKVAFLATRSPWSCILRCFYDFVCTSVMGHCWKHRKLLQSCSNEASKLHILHQWSTGHRESWISEAIVFTWASWQSQILLLGVTLNFLILFSFFFFSCTAS